MNDKPKGVRTGFVQNVLSTIRTLRGLANLGNNGGQTRDIDAECGHPVYIAAADYWKKFDRGDIAYRVVSIHAEECFKDRPQIFETEDPEQNTDFEREFDAMEDEVHLLSVIQRADILSGVGRFGVILLGLSDGLALSEPVKGFEKGFPEFKVPEGDTVIRKEEEDEEEEETPKRRPPIGNVSPIKRTEEPAPVDPNALRLLYLRTFDESMVTIKELEKDPTNARFGQPVLYVIQFWDESAENNVAGGFNMVQPPPPASGINTRPADVVSTRTTLTVHWSRIIHLADNRLRDEIFGTPRLKKVFNAMLNLHKVAAGSAEMFWKNAKGGLSLETLPSDEPITVDKEATKDELEAFYEGLKPYLVLEGMTAKQLAPAVADPTPHGDFQLKLIACAIGCPLRVFIGSEQAQLASGQDMKSWNERLQKRREEYLTPFVLRPTIDRLILMGVLPFPKGEESEEPLPGRKVRPNYNIFWSDLNTPTEAERADRAQKLTAALVAYVSGGLDQLIDVAHYLELVAGFTHEEVESILEEVGDKLIETDPVADAEQAALDAEMSHERELEKIKVAGETKVVAGGNGKPPFGR